MIRATVRPELPSGTVTFLFTDVEGSTKLLHELGSEGYAQALADHRRAIREACASEGGVEVDTQGDAFFFAFPTGPGAIDAASAFTEDLAFGPIAVRVGLHTGTPLLTEEGYVGGDVHRAARIAAVAHGGQVVVSSATAGLVDAAMLQDLGEHRLKDLSAPERIYQLGEQDFPPLKSLFQTNLPVPSTPFLGRERELGEVAAVLSRDEVRLLTLTGPGGTGKTRLGAQAAGLVSDAYSDGVYWVPLAPLRDPELVLSSAAQALGAGDGLAEHIRGRRMLIFFDNFEQVVEAAPGVAELLSTCPNLDLLVTSREPLHLTGEHEYPVPPLAQDEGVRFFLARARAVKPDFEANGVVPGICRRLDDLPLALELAAARVKALTPEQILARLEHRLPLLTGGARDLPERQRTLRATIEWSYELLSQEEQRLFRRISVFAGGCTLEAAEEVVDADLDTLQSLVDKSLIRHSDDRFWMLETIREFAADELRRDAGETEDIQQRHADWLLALAAEVDQGLEGAERAMWFSKLEREQDNLRAALTFVEDTGKTGMQLELVNSAKNFWFTHGDWLEGYRWTRVALSRSEGERSMRRATAIYVAASLADRLGAMAEVQGYLEDGLSIFRELGDAKGTAQLLMISGELAADAGDTAEGERLLEEALALAGGASEARLTAIVLANLGDMALTRGNYAQAITRTEEAHTLFRELGLEDRMSWTLYNLAVCLLRSGREAEALSAARESLTLSHFDITIRIWTFGLLGVLAARAGEAEAGATLIGVVDAARERVSLVLTNVEAELYDQAVEELSRALGQKRYEAAFAAGRAMSLEEGVEHALGSLD